MAKISKKTFKIALKNSGGNQSTIAKALSKTRGAVSIFLKKNPDMRALCDSEAERIIDVAENILDFDITEKRNIDSAKWKLTNSKRGKSRGYGSKTEIEFEGKISATDMTDEEFKKAIERLRKK